AAAHALGSCGTRSGDLAGTPDGGATGDGGTGGTGTGLGGRSAAGASGSGSTSGNAGAGGVGAGGGGAAGAAGGGEVAVDTRPVVSVRVSGYQLLVQRRAPDGSTTPAAPFDLRGVSWSPTARGQGAPNAATYATWAPTDAPLMRAAHINTVKTYSPPSRAALDTLLANGIVAVVNVLARLTDDYATTVTNLRDH